jgi:hypothetical protein
MALSLISNKFIGGKCQLQEQYCDIMDPTKQCCPGTSCGVRRNDDHVANICVICRDLGQPCNATKLCCMGLQCQKITKFASVCNPEAHTPFPPYKINTNDDYDDYENKYY